MLIAGIGRSDITPPIGIAHAGWGASTHECAEGIDMPLYCTALYVANEDTQALIIDLDLTGVTEPLDSQIRQAASEASGVPGDNIRISSTHTHAAPAFGGPWLVEGVDLLEQFFAELPEKTAAAALAAAESAVPATVGAATGECGININRRPADTGGRLFTGRNWDGYVDPEVLVLGFDDTKGKPIATVLHYACHPTILGPENRLLSPDYPGHARRVVEENIGGLCLFLQGSAGNQGPVHGFVGDVEVARKQGKILGLAAASVRMQVDPFPREEHLVEIVPSGADLGMYEDVPVGEPDSTLRVTNRFIDLPAGEFPPEDEARRFAEEKRMELVAAREGGDDVAIKAAVMAAKRANFTVTNARTAKGGVVNVRVQAMRIGSTVLIGLPLEPFAEFAAEMRQLSPAPLTGFAGYSNGLLGYMPTFTSYEEGGYEVGNTPLRAGAGEEAMRACAEVASEVWAG